VVLRDVPPYVMAGGNSAQPHGINSEGLKRRGFSLEAIDTIRRAYKTLYRSKLTFEDAKQAIAVQAQQVPQLETFARFLESTERGIIR
jgi:UDP-N-acetylglucosamine acyltransferase